MKVTWTNNVRNTLINKEDKRKKQEKKKTHPDISHQQANHRLLIKHKQ